MLLWVLAGAVAHTSNSNSFRGKRIKQLVIWAAIAVCALVLLKNIIKQSLIEICC